ncbi:hypothetical protein GSF22_00745 [Micromonospora echinofusca]|uniref:Tetratricopeptide repeat-containing protein n=2 Tax=Micromonospora echinofusca TaxID=47858 RepID=A0ABS3VJ45_MICEH|nr:hypothetical protein [Micromonospora echinofusca]
MPYGPGQVAAVEQLVRRADAEGDAHLAFAARMLATTAYVYGGEPAKSFVSFSWCLADFDRAPQPYHARHAGNLLWHFKYMINALLDFPEVPLDRTYAVLDDMERRYRDGGHSLQTVYKHRHRVARHLGADEEAAEWYRRWVTTPRDDLSDCAGCDPSAQAGYLAATGQDEAAVALAEPVLAGRLSCTEQPQGILTALLLPYLRTGRRDAARDAHRQAYRRIRGNLADLGQIGEHLEFCALTGNEARGLEIVERHLEWLDRAPSPGAALEFSGAAALVLRRLDAAGHGDLTVHRRAHADRPAADVPVGALAVELADLATGLAARFDERNGTDTQSRRLAARLTAEPVGAHLPLSASLRRQPPVRPGTDPATATPSGTDPATTTPSGTAATATPAGAGTAGGPASVARPAVEIPADATAGELLDLAAQRWRADRLDEMAAVLARYDERFTDDPGVPELVRVRRVELRAAEFDSAEELPAARAANEEAMRRYRELGEPVREQIVAGRLGVLCCALGESDEGLRLARTAAEYLAEHGDPVERAGGHDRLASALIRQERWAEALDAVGRAEEAAKASDDPYLPALLVLRRTQCLEQLDQPAEFRAAARRARELSRELAMPRFLTASCLAYARAVDDPAEAVDACDEALRVAPAEAALPVRLTRGRLLMAADRPAEAVEDFVEAVALCVERGVVDGAAFLRWELANAYRLAGRLAEAAEVAEEAVGALDRLGHQSEADQCRHLLANIYLALDEDQPALALLDQLAENLDGPDNLPGRAQVLEEAGGVLYDRDRDVLAAQRFAAAATAYQLAGLSVDELRSRRREAAALLWSGDVTQALAAVDRADQVAAALPAATVEQPAVLWELAMLADAAARVLLGADRPGEALDRLAGVAGQLRAIDAFGEALQVELLTGELLLRLDRPAEAEPVLRRALGALPKTSGAVPRAAWLLARALTGLGRTAEAEALRDEYRLADGD